MSGGSRQTKNFFDPDGVYRTSAPPVVAGFEVKKRVVKKALDRLNNKILLVFNAKNPALMIKEIPSLDKLNQKQIENIFDSLVEGGYIHQNRYKNWEFTVDNRKYKIVKNLNPLFKAISEIPALLNEFEGMWNNNAHPKKAIGFLSTSLNLEDIVDNKNGNLTNIVTGLNKKIASIKKILKEVRKIKPFCPKLGISKDNIKKVYNYYRNEILNGIISKVAIKKPGTPTKPISIPKWVPFFVGLIKELNSDEYKDITQYIGPERPLEKVFNKVMKKDISKMTKKDKNVFLKYEDILLKYEGTTKYLMKFNCDKTTAILIYNYYFSDATKNKNVKNFIDLLKKLGSKEYGNGKIGQYLLKKGKGLDTEFKEVMGKDISLMTKDDETAFLNLVDLFLYLGGGKLGSLKEFKDSLKDTFGITTLHGYNDKNMKDLKERLDNLARVIQLTMKLTKEFGYNQEILEQIPTIVSSVYSKLFPNSKKLGKLFTIQHGKNVVLSFKIPTGFISSTSSGDITNLALSLSTVGDYLHMMEKIPNADVPNPVNLFNAVITHAKKDNPKNINGYVTDYLAQLNKYIKALDYFKVNSSDAGASPYHGIQLNPSYYYDCNCYTLKDLVDKKSTLSLGDLTTLTNLLKTDLFKGHPQMIKTLFENKTFLLTYHFWSTIMHRGKGAPYPDDLSDFIEDLDGLVGGGTIEQKIKKLNDLLNNKSNNLKLIYQYLMYKAAIRARGSDEKTKFNTFKNWSKDKQFDKKLKTFVYLAVTSVVSGNFDLPDTTMTYFDGLINNTNSFKPKLKLPKYIPIGDDQYISSGNLDTLFNNKVDQPIPIYTKVGVSYKENGALTSVDDRSINKRKNAREALVEYFSKQISSQLESKIGGDFNFCFDKLLRHFRLYMMINPDYAKSFKGMLNRIRGNLGSDLGLPSGMVNAILVDSTNKFLENHNKEKSKGLMFAKSAASMAAAIAVFGGLGLIVDIPTWLAVGSGAGFAGKAVYSGLYSKFWGEDIADKNFEKGARLFISTGDYNPMLTAMRDHDKADQAFVDMLVYGVALAIPLAKLGAGKFMEPSYSIKTDVPLKAELKVNENGDLIIDESNNYNKTFDAIRDAFGDSRVKEKGASVKVKLKWASRPSVLSKLNDILKKGVGKINGKDIVFLKRLFVIRRIIELAPDFLAKNPNMTYEDLLNSNFGENSVLKSINDDFSNFRTKLTDKNLKDMYNFYSKGYKFSPKPVTSRVKQKEEIVGEEQTKGESGKATPTKKRIENIKTTCNKLLEEHPKYSYNDIIASSEGAFITEGNNADKIYARLYILIKKAEIADINLSKKGDLPRSLNYIQLKSSKAVNLLSKFYKMGKFKDTTLLGGIKALEDDLGSNIAARVVSNAFVKNALINKEDLAALLESGVKGMDPSVKSIKPNPDVMFERLKLYYDLYNFRKVLNVVTLNKERIMPILEKYAKALSLINGKNVSKGAKAELEDELKTWVNDVFEIATGRSPIFHPFKSTGSFFWSKFLKNTKLGVDNLDTSNLKMLNESLRAYAEKRTKFYGFFKHWFGKIDAKWLTGKMALSIHDTKLVRWPVGIFGFFRDIALGVKDIQLKSIVVKSYNWGKDLYNASSEATSKFVKGVGKHVHNPKDGFMKWIKRGEDEGRWEHSIRMMPGFGTVFSGIAAKVLYDYLYSRHKSNKNEDKISYISTFSNMFSLLTICELGKNTQTIYEFKNGGIKSKKVSLTPKKGENITDFRKRLYNRILQMIANGDSFSGILDKLETGGFVNYSDSQTHGTYKTFNIKNTSSYHTVNIHNVLSPNSTKKFDHLDNIFNKNDLVIEKTGNNHRLLKSKKDKFFEFGYDAKSNKIKIYNIFDPMLQGLDKKSIIDKLKGSKIFKRKIGHVINRKHFK